MISKIWILRKLWKFKKGLDSVDMRIDDRSDLIRWERNFRAFLYQLYPNGSDLTTESDSVMQHAAQHYNNADNDPNHSNSKLNHKKRYSIDYNSILQELRSTVEEQGIPPGFKPPTWNQYVVGISMVVASIILTVIATLYFAERDNSERAAERILETNRQAVIGVSDFYRLLNTFDTHFKETAFDSAVNMYAQSGGFQSGSYIEGMLDFAKDARRNRDSSIDSALVRLEQLGVDADTLKYPKRLPIRMGQALKGRAKALGLDIGAINSVLRNDSL